MASPTKPREEQSVPCKPVGLPQPRGDNTIAEETHAGANARAWLAGSESERLAAYRLRYHVYVGEQGKGYPEADHSALTLSDELDDEAELILVSVDGFVGGTVRGNLFGSCATRHRYGKYFEVSRVSGFDPARIAVASRMAAHPAYRHGAVRRLLFESLYSRGLALQTELCFVACAPALLPLYRRYGWREYVAPIEDPIVGARHRMLLVLDDIEYLERMNSPYARIALEHAVAPCSRAARRALYGLIEDYEAGREDSPIERTADCTGGCP